MARNYLVFYITCPDEPCTRKLGSALLEKKLVACANSFPVASAFWWDGTITTEPEWVLLLKTVERLETRVEQAVSELHPYQVPCIMRFEARANDAYVNWVENSVIPD